MPLTPDDILALKKPFGILILDKDATKNNILNHLKLAKRIITVGDATTDRIYSFGVVPNVAIIDGKERRSKRNYPDAYHAKELRCSNKKGTISADAVNVLRSAMSMAFPVRIMVEGEEDMLALAVFTLASKGTFVLYGQPLEGIVIVETNEETKRRAKDLMDRIGVQ